MPILRKYNERIGYLSSISLSMFEALLIDDRIQRGRVIVFFYLGERDIPTML